jgi:hypothetical protein
MQCSKFYSQRPIHSCVLNNKQEALISFCFGRYTEYCNSSATFVSINEKFQIEPIQPTVVALLLYLFYFCEEIITYT